MEGKSLEEFFEMDEKFQRIGNYEIVYNLNNKPLFASISDSLASNKQLAEELSKTFSEITPPSDKIKLMKKLRETLESEKEYNEKSAKFKMEEKKLAKTMQTFCLVLVIKLLNSGKKEEEIVSLLQELYK